MEYGEEEDDEAPMENIVDRNKTENFHSSLHPNGKPFWAAP